MINFKDYFDLVFENSKPRSYSCLMLDCSNFETELKNIQSHIEKEDIYDEEGYGLEKEPHITVLYGIHEQDPDVVKDVLELTSVEYQLEKLSLFENDNYDVLKCSVKSKDLRKLNKQVTKLLDYTNDYPDYKPHLTVAYLKPGTGKKYVDMESKAFKTVETSNKFIFSNKDSEKVFWTIK
jgi:2'-5' RNA ligase